MARCLGLPQAGVKARAGQKACAGPSKAVEALEIVAGTKVQVYKYEGEGTSIVGAKGKMLVASCPSSPDYDVDGSASRFRPKKADWWVLIKGLQSQGWVKVDGEQVVGASKATEPK